MWTIVGLEGGWEVGRICKEYIDFRYLWQRLVKGVSILKIEERFNPRTEGWLGGFLRICKAGYMCWLGVLPGRVARPALYIATTANEDQYNPNQPPSNHEGTQPHKWTPCELCMNIEFLWPSFSSCECVTDIAAFAVDIAWWQYFSCVTFCSLLILIKS